MKLFFLLCFLSIFLNNYLATSTKTQDPTSVYEEYQKELETFRKNYGHQGQRTMPKTKFFLFGMGDRRKLIYLEQTTSSSILKDLITSEILYTWNLRYQLIVPPTYSVYITTTEGKNITIVENSVGVYVDEKLITSNPINLPEFKNHPYAMILSVLHQEILINIQNGKPLPNLIVYGNPWYRDGALMSYVLKITNNTDQVQKWIESLSYPFDQNAGMDEPDNLGESLYLISLVPNGKNHPLVPKILDSLKSFEVILSNGSTYVDGFTDGGHHPVYQTKWAKFGLRSLGLRDPYFIPLFDDSYSTLFWQDFRDTNVDGSRFGFNEDFDYPYLGWDQQHFYNTTNGIVSDLDYPLSWESNASKADYRKMQVIGNEFVGQSLSLPHGWHAASMFNYLYFCCSE